MPGIATGEVYSFAEGKLYLYASASGNTSGSGVGFVGDATLKFAFGWVDAPGANAQYVRVLTGQRADLAIGALVADLNLFRLAQATAAVNARFEGLISAGAALQKSAMWVLYSGVVDEAQINQNQGALFGGTFAAHFNQWSAFGQ